jgi:TnpA family transposase
MPEIRERLNLYLTKPLADELRRLIPVRERTRFVEEVLARELRKRKILEDENHPELASFEDVERWIEEGRKGMTRDFSKEWGEND